MTLLIPAALLLTLLACWLWYRLQEPEAEVTPRRLWDLICREEMDQHPTERLDWRPYRRRRPERVTERGSEASRLREDDEGRGWRMIRRWLARHGYVVTFVRHRQPWSFNVYAEPLRWYFGIVLWRAGEP